MKFLYTQLLRAANKVDHRLWAGVRTCLTRNPVARTKKRAGTKRFDSSILRFFFFLFLFFFRFLSLSNGE